MNAHELYDDGPSSRYCYAEDEHDAADDMRFYNDDLMALLSGWWALTCDIGFCARCDGAGAVMERGDEKPCPCCGEVGEVVW